MPRGQAFGSDPAPRDTPSNSLQAVLGIREVQTATNLDGQAVNRSIHVLVPQSHHQHETKLRNEKEEPATKVDRERGTEGGLY